MGWAQANLILMSCLQGHNYWLSAFGFYNINVCDLSSPIITDKE